ncbi:MULTISPECIES: hypothetical protein [unclassified Streptomyces]|uniref:hypothetical protein n=1 Tax=unclassified Streptomyces TaxID=2593676 RepID=UPI00278C39C6|nr:MULTISPECIES: hypothetical protein [unclassified Streptomyces]
MRARKAIGPVAGALAGVLALTACGSESGEDTGASARPSATRTSVDPSSPASKKEELKASASEAAKSASARASELEASVSADVERNRQEFTKQLKKADGQGNAVRDVELTGKRIADTKGVRAVVVHITNTTDKTASYAVQVDFTDPDGKLVESKVVGAKDLKAGGRAQPLAISTKPPEPHLKASVAKAQRY